jgi:hypothetical protein
MTQTLHMSTRKWPLGQNTKLCAKSISGASKNRPLVFVSTNLFCLARIYMHKQRECPLKRVWLPVCVDIHWIIHYTCIGSTWSGRSPHSRWILKFGYSSREWYACTHNVGRSWQGTIQFYPIWGLSSSLIFTSSVPDAITVWPRVRALGMTGWRLVIHQFSEDFIPGSIL